MTVEFSEQLQNLLDAAQREVLACPVCKAQLNLTENLECQACQLQFNYNNGLWHFLTVKQTADYCAFLESYRHLRQGDGWEQTTDNYYLSLPFLPARYNDKNLQFVWRIRQRSFTILLKQAGIGNGAWALDLGAGNGWLSRRLSETGWQTLALDLHCVGRDSLAGAEVFLRNGANFLRGQASMAELPVQTSSVQLVVSSGALHYTNSEKTLTEIYRVLKSGGLAVINDSPAFISAKDGDGMVADQSHRLSQTYGRAPLLTGGRGYFLLPEFIKQATQQGFSVKIYWPERPGTFLKRFARHLLKPQQRHQARFPIIVLTKLSANRSKSSGQWSVVGGQGGEVQSQNTEARIQKPVLGVKSSKSDFSFQNPKSKVQNLKSKIKSPQSLILLLIFGICVLTNLIGLWLKPFDGLYGQDAYAYYAHSVELSQRFSLFHHWQWEEQARLLYWPFGYPLLVALFFKIIGVSASAAQFVSLLAWAGASSLTAAISQQISAAKSKINSTVVGLIAGGLMALSPLGRQAAVTVMADATTLFWTVLAIWLALTARQKDKDWRLIAAGAALGLACVTRFFALTALPVILLCIFWPKPANKPFKLTTLLWSALALGLICLPQIIINIIYPDPLWSNSWLAQWTPANWLNGAFTTREGLATYEQPPLIFNLLGTLFSPRFLTPAVVPLLAVGLLVSFGQPKARRQIHGWLLISWWLLPVLLLAGMPYENERYSLTFLPPIAILAGLGTGWLWVKAAQAPLKLRRTAQISLIGLFVTSVIGLAWLSQRHLNGFIAIKDSDLVVVYAAEKILPPDASLITFGISLTFDRYTLRPVRDLYFLDAAKIEALQSTSSATYLLVDASDMRGQWKDTAVGAAFEAALTCAASPPIAQFGIYQLWLLNNDYRATVPLRVDCGSQRPPTNRQSSIENRQ